jgi:hypothetical protein
MAFDVFSSLLPEVVADDVVQLVSGFALDGAAVCANEAPAIKDARKAATTTR